MIPVEHAAAWLAFPAVFLVFAVGAYAVAVLDAWTGALVAGRSARGAFVEPLARSAGLLRQQRVTTERPDAPAWAVATAGYVGLVALLIALVPLDRGVIAAALPGGIVAWGAAEALVIVAVYLHGWSPNSWFALVGGYRFIAQALSYELLSMFVLIAAALPAESLAIDAIVESQAHLWNVVRQPLGLPLWWIVTLGVAFWGPLDLADGGDLHGGTSVESSGVERLLWQVARAGALVAFSAMGAAVFLGGYLGPWLPGWLWMVVKTLALLATAVAARHLLARQRPERFVVANWTVLLPLAFLDLAIAGVVALR